jgi:PHD/YefM family antitoxin component YafN of YafNO toxin-antitoxin module
MSQANFESIQTMVANQGATIKSLETQIGMLSKLVTTHVSIDITGKTVDNPKEECISLKEKEIEREQDEEELPQLKKWFEKLRMTLEEAYDEFMGELDEY